MKQSENQIKSKDIFATKTNDISIQRRSRRGCDCMAIGFITTYATSLFHQHSCEFQTHPCEVFLIHYVGSSANKTDCHYMNQILLKVMTNKLTLTLIT